MAKAYIDIQSVLLEYQRNFHYIDLSALCKELRDKHQAQQFFLVGNHTNNRMTKMLVEEAQVHELHHEGVLLDTFNEYDNRTYDETTLVTELSKDFFCQQELSENEYIIVTASTAILPMVYFMTQNAGNISLILPKTHQAYDEVKKAFDVYEDIELSHDGPSVFDRICMKELRDMLLWAEQREMKPTRIFVINQLKKFSKIEPAMTNFFLNVLVYNGIIEEQKHEGEGPDGKTFFSVHFKDVEAINKLIGDIGN